MKQATRTLVVLLVIFCSGKIKSQLSGTYAIPATYTSIAAAITDLNSFGVSGPVVFNIAAGYTETVTTGGFTLNAITGASSANQITFQKSSLGANPIIYAYTGTATPASAAQDGVWRFNGSDFITIDGIDINDPNTTNPTTMEFGYGFFKANATDGCQNNTIKNCVITLNRVNNAAGSTPATDGSRGIDVVNASIATHTTALTITAASGANSNNKFYSNTIQNCNIGIAIIGYAAASPFTLGDTGNDIGGSSLSTGNTIINFGGGGTTASAGIRTLAQYSLSIAYNLINSNNGSGVSHTGDLRGIYVNTALSANSTISSNTVTVRNVGTTAQLTGIENASGSTAASNAIIISSNFITNCTYSTATSGNFYGILNSATPASLSIVSNTLMNNSTSATSGSYYNIYNSGATPLSASVLFNTINSISLTATSTSATFRGILFSSANSSALLTINGNSIQSVIYSGTSSGDFSFIHHAVSAGTVIAVGNSASGLTIPTTGTFYFMNNSNGTPTSTFSNNTGVFSKTGSGGTVYGYYNFGSPSGGNVILSNNNFSNINLTGATTFYGLFHGTATSQNVSITSNTVSNVVGGTSGVNGIYFSYGFTNNVIANNSITALSSTSGTLTGLNIGGTASTSLTVSGNTIGALSSGSASTVYGYYQQSGTSTSVYKNKIYDVANTATTGVVIGMNFISGTTNNTYNNIIGDLRTPSVIAVNPLVGISLTGGTTHNLSFNTINLNATSTGSLFGSSVVSANLTPTSISLRNNLFINNSVATGTGITTVLRSSAVTTNYSSSSNNNNLYGGTPGSVNLIFYDGTNSLQTLTAFKTAVSPADANSVTENTGFLSTTGSNSNFLHVNNTFTTLTESGGFNISGITDDFDSQVRSGNAGYSGTGTAPDIGADENNPNLPTCTTVNAGTIVVTSYSRCAGQTVALTSTGSVLGGGTTFQWKESATSGGPYTNVAGGSGPNSPALTSSGLTAGTHYFVLVSTCPAISGTNTTNEVTVTVNAYPTATASIIGTNTICSGSVLNLTAGSDIATSYKWIGPNGYSTTAQNPSISNLSLSSSGIYTLVTSTGACSTTALSANVTMISGPSMLTVTPLSSTICAGSTQTITVAGGVTPLILMSGLSTNTNINVYNSYPSPYSLYFGGQRFQFMVLASELAAAGFSANAPINAINLPIASLGTNWGVTRFDLQNFQVSIGATTATSLSAFVTTLTPVFGPVNYTPTVGYANLHNFSSPFIWNGTDNVVVETAFSNNLTGGTNDAIFTYTTATSFQSSISYRADGVAAATMYTTTTVTSSYNNRPDFKLYGSVQSAYNWSSGLSAATGGTVTGSPSISSIYTVSSTFGTCTSSNVANVSVLNTPTVNLATTNTLLCGGTSATLTATGAQSYVWNTGATSSSIVVTPGTSTVYSIVGTNAPCVTTASANISLTATNNPIISFSGSSGICTGQTASITANGASTYLWNTGSTNNTITDTPTSNTTYTVTGTDALGCSTTSTQLVTVAASLSISIVGPSTICLGQTAVLQGNGGVTYQWDGGATTNTISINPTTNTTYSVIGSSGTCSNSAIVTVTVNSNPTFAISGNTIICVGNTTTLTASGTAATYTWNTGALTATAAVSPTTNTTYTATGYSSAGCAVVHTVAVVSNSLPIISIASTATGVCVNSSVTLTASGANTYTWVTSGSPTTTLLTVSPTANTIYTVNGTNAANCVSSKTISITSYSLPVLSIAPSSATVCALSPVNLTASGALSFTWSALGGSNSAVTYTPSASTIYTVSGTNTLGCVASGTAAVTTNSLPVITISPASTTLCSLSPATFTATGANSYVWNGATIGSTFTSISAASTVYSVTGYNSNNCGATQTVAAIALPLPVVAVTPSFGTVCNLSTGIYTVSGASTYLWENGATTTTVAITPSATTVFSVTGTDANGCTGQGSAVILTTPAPILSVSPVSASVCPNTSQSFTASGALTYSWSNGPTTAIAVITPSISGVYTVTGTNNAGCKGTATVNLTTKAVPVIVISPATSSLCLNSPASFTANGAASYTWNNGITNPDIYVTATSNTVYSVSGKNALGCTGSATVGLYVWQPPVINLTASSMTLCAKETVTLNATGAATYTWYPFNVTGSVLTNAASNTLQYTIIGVDVNGCSNTGSITVTVDKCTGIARTSSLDNAVHMYPNPSTGVVNADFDFDGKKEIMIMNSTGAVVALISTENRSETFNLSDKAKGVYFIKVTTASASANYKVIVE